MPFKILGASNGVFMDTLFNYKTMVYIHATTHNGELGFDLCIAALEPTNDKQDSKSSPGLKKDSKAGKKMLLRVPLTYTGVLNMKEI